MRATTGDWRYARAHVDCALLGGRAWGCPPSGGPDARERGSLPSTRRCRLRTSSPLSPPEHSPAPCSEDLWNSERPFNTRWTRTHRRLVVGPTEHGPSNMRARHPQPPPGERSTPLPSTSSHLQVFRILRDPQDNISLRRQNVAGDECRECHGELRLSRHADSTDVRPNLCDETPLATIEAPRIRLRAISRNDHCTALNRAVFGLALGG